MNKKDFGKLLGELSEDLKKSITDAKTELTSARTTALANLRSIQEKDQTAAAKLGEFDQKLEKLSADIASAQMILNEINAIKDAAVNPETGLQQDINKVNSVKEQATAFRQEISDIRDMAKKYETEMAATVAESKKGKEQIEQAQQVADETAKNIEKIYQLATDTGLAGSFDNRKKQLEPTVRLWNRLFIGGIAALFISILIVFFQKNFALSSLLYLRLTLFLPGVGLILYCARQYSKERNLLEKYAFKAAMALALESYTDLLSRRFNDDRYKDKLLNFVLSAMQSIYKEPHEEIRKQTYKLGFGGKLGKMTAELVEDINIIKNDVETIKEEVIDSVPEVNKTNGAT